MKDNIAFLHEAAECLKVLAHHKRLEIIAYLMKVTTANVGEIALQCKLNSNVASEHLRLMQRCNLLSSNRNGRNTYYTIEAEELHTIMKCIQDKFKKNNKG